MSTIPWLFLVLATFLPVLPLLPGQVSPQTRPEPGFLLSRVDGTQWPVRLTGVRGQGRDLELRVQHRTRTLWVGVEDVLGLHGPAPRVKAAAAVYLAGSDELKGEITGGDRWGETLTVATPALGKVTVKVDHLRCIVFRDNTSASRSAFRLPPDSEREEALFQRARRGFDTILGALERFTSEGILFKPTRAESPRLFRYRDLAGFAFSAGRKPEDQGPVQLITTAGDLLRVHLLRLEEGRLFVKADDDRELEVALDRVAALGFLAGGGRRYLSDLPVLREEERASADELGSRPLFPYRRDRTASGGVVAEARHPADGFLTVDGHTYGKGLGVHSRSRLTFRVPPGCRRFHALVGIDDEVMATNVRGDADVRVTVGDKVLFRANGLHRGQAPRNLGILSVEPGVLLTLEVDFGKGMFLGDRVDWLLPVFLP